MLWIFHHFQVHNNDYDQSNILYSVEEENQCRGAPGGGEGEGVFVTLGTSILTTRSCNPKDGSRSVDVRKGPPRRSLSVQECEVFLPITEQVMKSCPVFTHSFIINNLGLPILNLRSGARLGLLKRVGCQVTT